MDVCFPAKADIKQTAAILSDMKKQMWFGYLDEGNDEESIVLHCKLLTDIPSDEVYLFNFTKQRIIKYKKEKVRKRLRSAINLDKDLISKILSYYHNARKIHIYEADIKAIKDGGLNIHDLQNKYNEKFNEEVEKEGLNDIWNEICSDAESLHNSEEQGWYYADSDED